MHFLTCKSIFLIALIHRIAGSSVHFPDSGSSFTERTGRNYDQTIGEQENVQENVEENLQERSAFNTPNVGILSRGSNDMDTMYLKSRQPDNRQGVIWPTNNKQEYPFNRRKRSLPPPPLLPPLPFHLPPPFPFPYPFPPGMLPPPMLPPPSIQQVSSLQRRQTPPQDNIQSRNGLIIKTVSPKYNPPINYAEEDRCVYHTLVNGDSEVLLRKILPIRMRGRTLVRTCIPPIPDTKDPRYKVLLRGGQKHSYGNVNLSMKF